MHVIIAYDISGNKLRRMISDYLEEKGIRSQKSVFECELDRVDLLEIVSYMRALELGEKDSVAFYPLCQRCAGDGIIMGLGLEIVKKDWIII